MMTKFRFTFLFLSLFFLGCEREVSFEAKEIHWDRDMCERCKMVLSDRKFSAQVLHPKTAKKYTFDDIGCVILWFKEDKIEWANEAVIWVNDAKTGKWVNARKAYYSVDNITPMAYGFGAHLNKEDIEEEKEIIDFDEVTKRVIKIGK